jgi:hypothetical protein
LRRLLGKARHLSDRLESEIISAQLAQHGYVERSGRRRLLDEPARMDVSVIVPSGTAFGHADRRAAMPLRPDRLALGCFGIGRGKFDHARDVRDVMQQVDQPAARIKDRTIDGQPVFRDKDTSILARG